MSTLYRQRVCMIGHQQDMLRLTSTLLDNCGYLEEPEDRPAWTLAELQEQLEQTTKENGDANDDFLYPMISRHRYGTAIEGTCRLHIAQHPCSLYSALFRYDSSSPFQALEWLDLYKKCGKPLIVIQRAASDFTLDKGEILISGGQITESWDTMCECWLWLMEQYGCGLPPDEAKERLDALDSIMRQEEYDMDVRSLLRSSRVNLETLSLSVQDQEAMKQALDASEMRQDFVRLWELQYILAESVLWETEHNHKWFATLDTLLSLYQE